MKRLSLAASTALALLACGGDERAATQVLVMVEADEDVRAALSALDIEIRGSGEDGGERTQHHESLEPPDAWPLELSILPQGGDAQRRWSVLVTALAGTTTLASSAREGGFERGALVRVTLQLTAGDCGDDPCGATPGGDAGEPENRDCAGVRCYDPPPNGCADDSTLSIPDAIGFCSEGACTYVSGSEPCEEGACTDGVCTLAPCQGVRCVQPPAPRCDDEGNLLVANPAGRCVVRDGAPACTYTAIAVQCSDGCEAGKCNGDACAGVTCNRPPARHCDGAELVVFDVAGRCVDGECEYQRQVVACAEGCSEGSCTGEGLCDGVTCQLPPANRCAGADLRVFSSEGTCIDGGCVYASELLACAQGCQDAVCVGDPCAGVSCSNPPAAYCANATTLRTFAATGTCYGAGQCSYATADSTCTACISGRCVECAVADDCDDSDVCSADSCEDNKCVRAPLSTPGCVDACPTDPDKTAPGACGCGTPDTNSDGDGDADCNEDCDDDPGKTAPGVCGCGRPDVDSDDDGALDCNDACPYDGSVTTAPCPSCLGGASNFDPTAFVYTASADVTGCTATINTSSAAASMITGCGVWPTPVVVTQTTATGSSEQAVVIPLRGLNVGSGGIVNLVGDKPVIFAVDGDATVAGTISASATGAMPGAGGGQHCGSSTGGNASSGTCAGGASGGGGGGFSTAGGLGGNGGSGTRGAAGTGNRGATTQTPLLGGCAGGLGGGDGVDAPGGAGGGAVQLAVGGTLILSGLVRANGGTGGGGTCGTEGGGAGGGSGGGVLIEARTLDVSGATLQVNGGNGGVSGSGDAGGAGSTNPANAGAAGTNDTTNGGGGGGGGYGRIVTRMLTCGG